jgi:hypothetical protein
MSQSTVRESEDLALSPELQAQLFSDFDIENELHQQMTPTMPTVHGQHPINFYLQGATISSNIIINMSK